MRSAFATLANRLVDLRHVFRYGVPRERLFARAVERTDFFLGLFRSEYEELASKWGELPEFVDLPFSFAALTTELPKPRNGTVILGNSRNFWNNHLDLIDLINQVKYSDRLTFLLPFNYGVDGAYASAVRAAAKQSPRTISLLEDFLPRDSYFDLLRHSVAAVFNSYRQLAMGNIWHALCSGVKVYLNEKNIVYHWLRDNGIMVFPVEQFVTDLENDNLALTLEHHVVNVEQMTCLRSERSRDEFRERIENLIRERRVPRG